MQVPAQRKGLHVKMIYWRRPVTYLHGSWIRSWQLIDRKWRGGLAAKPKTTLPPLQSMTLLHDITTWTHFISFHPLLRGVSKCVDDAVVLWEVKTCVCIVNIVYRWHVIIIYNPYGYGYGSQAQPPSLSRACSQVCPSVWKPACCRYFPSLASGSQNLPGRTKRSAWTSSCLTSQQMACVVGSTNGLGDSAMMIRGDAEVSNQTNPQNVEPDLAHLSQAGCKSKTI